MHIVPPTLGCLQLPHLLNFLKWILLILYTYPKLVPTSISRTKKTTNWALICKVSGINRCKNQNLISIVKGEKHI